MRHYVLPIMTLQMSVQTTFIFLLVFFIALPRCCFKSFLRTKCYEATWPGKILVFPQINASRYRSSNMQISASEKKIVMYGILDGDFEIAMLRQLQT